MSTEFAWSAEQVELRRTVRAFCAEVSTQAEIRRLMETEVGYDPGVWTRLGNELGVLGLAADEEYGGIGDGFVSLAVVIEELGRALVCAPLIGSIVLAATALRQVADKAAKADLLPGILAGETAAAFAAPVHRGGFDPAAVTVTATATAAAGEGFTLNGVVDHVLDGAAAELILVPAILEGPAAGSAGGSAPAIGLFAVAADAAGLGRESTPTMDLTRRQAVVRLDGTPARLIAGPAEAGAVCARTAEIAAVLLAAEQVGAAQFLLDSSVEYAKTRLQFGRPIGSFQAVKHLCANMLVEVEQARSTAYHAAWALDEGTDDLQIAASLAQSVCSAAFRNVAAMTVQVHGGIGFTWEHPTHLYLKRAYTDAALFGGVSVHQERLAQLVLDGAVGA